MLSGGSGWISPGKSNLCRDLVMNRSCSNGHIGTNGAPCRQASFSREVSIGKVRSKEARIHLVVGDTVFLGE